VDRHELDKLRLRFGLEPRPGVSLLLFTLGQVRVPPSGHSEVQVVAQHRRACKLDLFPGPRGTSRPTGASGAPSLGGIE
jgi:hypothetical protein